MVLFGFVLLFLSFEQFSSRIKTKKIVKKNFISFPKKKIKKILKMVDQTLSQLKDIHVCYFCDILSEQPHHWGNGQTQRFQVWEEERKEEERGREKEERGENEN